tara:strand:- start:452 stop:1213 length:762 start_codon:yes stop_codon:yes gene_type:complete
MSREGLVSLLITSMVLFDLFLLGFVGCVERKYDEENYPVVMETGSDVVVDQDAFEEEDTTEEEVVDLPEDIGGDPMDPEDLEQFTDADEDETRGMDPDTADLVEDIQTMLDVLVGDPDSISIDIGNPKYPPCSGAFATSCKNRCAYNGNCPCQCDGACTKAKDCCEDRAEFCSAPPKSDTADTTDTVIDTAETSSDTAGPSSDAQLPAGECPKDCTSWYNGCNTCQCKDGKIGGCTKMGCPTKKDPYCKTQKT